MPISGGTVNLDVPVSSRLAAADPSVGRIDVAVSSTRETAPLVLSTIGPFGGADWAPGMGAFSVPAWSNANRGLWIPFRCPEQMTATGVVIPVQTQSGNICVAIYDSALNRLVTSGSVACAVGPANQLVALAPTVLARGRYYVAIAVDNVLAAFRSCVNIGIHAGSFGCFRQEAAFPLPALAVPVAITAVDTPILGVAFTANVF